MEDPSACRLGHRKRCGDPGHQVLRCCRCRARRQSYADEVGARPAQRVGLLAGLDVEGDAGHLEDLRPPGHEIVAPRARLVAVLEMWRSAEGDVVGAGLGRASWRRGARCRHRRRQCRRCPGCRALAHRRQRGPCRQPGARHRRAGCAPAAASPASSAAALAFCAISIRGSAEPASSAAPGRRHDQDRGDGRQQLNAAQSRRSSALSPASRTA